MGRGRKSSSGRGAVDLGERQGEFSMVQKLEGGQHGAGRNQMCACVCVEPTQAQCLHDDLYSGCHAETSTVCLDCKLSLLYTFNISK